MGYSVLKRKREIIFTAKIEHADRSKRKEPLPQQEQIVERVRGALEKELPEDISNTFHGMNIEVKVKAVRAGSAIVTFGAVLAAVGAYKNFYESAELIAEHAQQLLEIDLEPYGDFKITVQPRYYDSGLGSFGVAARRARLTPGRIFTAALLLLCVLEAVFIFLLVRGAVEKTYFPQPSAANQNAAPTGR